MGVEHLFYFRYVGILVFVVHLAWDYFDTHDRNIVAYLVAVYSDNGLVGACFYLPDSDCMVRQWVYMVKEHMVLVDMLVVLQLQQIMESLVILEKVHLIQMVMEEEEENILDTNLEVVAAHMVRYCS